MSAHILGPIQRHSHSAAGIYVSTLRIQPTGRAINIENSITRHAGSRNTMKLL